MHYTKLRVYPIWGEEATKETIKTAMTALGYDLSKMTDKEIEHAARIAGDKLEKFCTLFTDEILEKRQDPVAALFFRYLEDGWDWED